MTYFTYSPRNEPKNNKCSYLYLKMLKSGINHVFFLEYEIFLFFPKIKKLLFLPKMREKG